MLAVNLEAQSVGAIATPLPLIVSVASRVSPGQTPTGGDDHACRAGGALRRRTWKPASSAMLRSRRGVKGLGHSGVSPALGRFRTKQPPGFVDREQRVVLAHRDRTPRSGLR